MRGTIKQITRLRTLSDKMINDFNSRDGVCISDIECLKSIIDFIELEVE